MKARVGAWTFRIVEVARPGLGSLSFGLSLSLSRTLSIAYRRHGSRISAWRRMAVVRTAYAARRERESSPAFDDPVWHPRALRGGGAVGNALTRESQAHLERNGAVLLLVRHGRTGSGSAVGASGSGWSAPPRVTCCTATYSRGARCHGLNRLGVFRIYIHIYVHRYLVVYGRRNVPSLKRASPLGGIYDDIHPLHGSTSSLIESNRPRTESHGDIRADRERDSTTRTRGIAAPGPRRAAWPPLSEQAACTRCSEAW